MSSSIRVNERNCREIRKDKMSVGKKTAGLRCGKFSDLKSACSKMSVCVKIFQFQNMLKKVNDIATQKWPK